jgi:hypothetical protein
MSHRPFSNAANQRAAQTSPAMRRDDNEVGTFLYSGFINRGRAVSGNS